MLDRFFSSLDERPKRETEQMILLQVTRYILMPRKSAKNSIVAIPLKVF